MYPKNSTDFIDDVSNELNQPKELVNDFIHFVYSEFRKKLSNFDDITFTMYKLGTFEGSRKRILEERKRAMALSKTFPHKNYHALIKMLNSAIVKNDYICKEYYEKKLEKLDWHKKNGDPYKKYSKEQEEDCRGIIEHLNKEIECGGYITKENDDV